MSFISYAQNLEDVVLYRCLRDVYRGFYIDVGAQDPLVDSVTRAFYERGWRGMNIEPSTEYFHALQRDRGEDINLMTVVGREIGEAVFYEVKETGLSTTNPEYARRYAESGYQVRSREMPCTTLDEICRVHHIDTVHFLKIDAEGSEREVLEGFSFEDLRPWVVIAEATEPGSSRDMSARWESLILGRGYEPVYFDGLNRFYLAAEHCGLKERFSVSPNVFDHYVTYRERHAREELAAAESSAERERQAFISCVEQLTEKSDRLRKAVVELQHVISREQERLDELREQHDAERNRLVGELNGLRAETTEREHLVAERHAWQERELTLQVERLNGRLFESERELGRCQSRLRALRGSISWKITSPLREVRRAAVRVARLLRGQNGIAATASVGASSSIEAAVAAAEAEITIDPAVRGLSEPAQVNYRALREALARRA